MNDEKIAVEPFDGFKLELTARAIEKLQIKKTGFGRFTFIADKALVDTVTKLKRVYVETKNETRGRGSSKTGESHWDDLKDKVKKEKQRLAERKTESGRRYLHDFPSFESIRKLELLDNLLYVKFAKGLRRIIALEILPDTLRSWAENQGGKVAWELLVEHATSTYAIDEAFLLFFRDDYTPEKEGEQPSQEEDEQPVQRDESRTEDGIPQSKKQKRTHEETVRPGSSKIALLANGGGENTLHMQNTVDANDSAAQLGDHNIMLNSNNRNYYNIDTPEIWRAIGSLQERVQQQGAEIQRQHAEIQTLRTALQQHNIPVPVAVLESLQENQGDGRQLANPPLSPARSTRSGHSATASQHLQDFARESS